MLTLFISYGIIQLAYGVFNDCAYFGPTPANECGHYIAELGKSYGYYCIDDYTVEERWFQGEGCDPNNFVETFTHICNGNFDDSCNCVSNNKCESIELTEESCINSKPSGIIKEISKYSIGVCIQDGTYSAKYECDGINLIGKIYLGDIECNSNSATLVTDTVYNDKCIEQNAYFSSTCGSTTTTQTPADGLCCQCTTETKTTPGCSADLSCQTIICEADSFCCQQEWDSICSNDAVAVCTNGPQTTVATTTTTTTTTEPATWNVGDVVSFESSNYPNYFIRYENLNVRISENDCSTSFAKDSLWRIVSGLSDVDGMVSFESINYSGYYLYYTGSGSQKPIKLGPIDDFPKINSVPNKYAASFYIVPALNGKNNYISIQAQSVLFHMRHYSQNLILDSSNDNLKAEDASFLVH